ncbi:MAG: right-handed parallel beta-helix repeat-containing protein [Candidatus Amulumruptor caecigallinarius]|nr:right-handed parallel beta-helix repeat-containing protein [Candidatus Amulumruptor caecigallinarius]
MKRILTIVCLMLATHFVSFAGYVSPGSNETITLENLLSNPDVEMGKVGNSYHLYSDVTISQSDVFDISGDVSLLISGNASLVINGHAKFVGNGNTLIGSLDSTAPARSIRIDESGSGEFRQVKFEGIGIYSWTASPISAIECEFTHVTSASNSQAALAFGCSSIGNVVSGCTFTDNSVPAIASSANAYCGVTVENCTITDCNTDNRNAPMINLTTPAENGPTVLRGNTITGAKRNMVGGISISNMVGGNMGDVLIEENNISDCRYGINIYGPVNAQVRNNTLKDNRYENNPMNGGSGISCTAFAGLQNTIISGNHIEGSLWGVTLISYGFIMSNSYKGFALVSLGQPDNDQIDSPGNNVFLNNGNNGHSYDITEPYDLFNNTNQTVYAQNNIWSVPEQTPEEIEKVIFHKADSDIYGEVIFTQDTGSVSSVTSEAETLRYDPTTSTIIAAGIADCIEIIQINGGTIKKMNNTQMLSLESLSRGIYVVKATLNGNISTIKVYK